ncbi:hypothetical protein UFOVP84_142 [uncultured Caudovirales phage]|uniref:Uncharacterized protein n=1 Tax=uncultured Caudovirales phage TaxID=2100421 RepID=A0A6J5KXS1_9CAUD|nr:hypothetical protein UFOVP84_142 [uncultured Caudovirales phage]
MSLWSNKDLKAITGTSIAVTQGSANIVGTSTTFTTDLKEGSGLNISGVLYKILKITDDTHLSLVTPYVASTNATLSIPGATVNAGSFVVGTSYRILSLGTTTDWNVAAGTTGITYSVGDVFEAAVVGSGDGTTKLMSVFAQTIPTYLTQAPAVAAGSFTTGNQYTITLIGTTDFTLIGASANTVGLKFFATGAGTGSGTAVDAHPELDLSKIVFVSLEEAQLDSNKKKGIVGPGWHRINSYIDSDGNTRYRTECLVSMSTSQVISQDAIDDLIIADTNPVITIGTQPAAQNTSSGAATFSISATVSVVSPTATITYQWQKSVAGSTKFANVSGATSSSLVLSGQTSANTGDRYRVVMNTTPNAIAAVTSSAATLTFVS